MLAFSASQQPPLTLHIAGSSTMYNYLVLIAEHFQQQTGYQVIIEQMGTGPGISLFCDSSG
ncbi:MAG: substrate-binding domain-containing protein, partial [Pseudomonadota bacterium]